MIKLVAALACKVSVVGVCALAARPIHFDWRWHINSLLKIGFVDVTDDGYSRIFSVFLLVCSACLTVVAVTNKAQFRTTGRLFVDELYAVALALSLTTLYIFMGTKIIFDPGYFLVLAVLVFAGVTLVHSVLVLLRRQEGPDLVSSLFEAFVSPRHWAVLTMTLIPVVLLAAYKVDDVWANAINNLRMRLTMPNDLRWVVRDRFPGQSFAQPIAIDQPNYEMNTFFVLERPGRIVRLALQNGDISRETLLDISALVQTNVENGALGMALHPEYGLEPSPHRGFVYVYYTTVEGDHQLNRISRFDLAERSAEARLATQTILIELSRNAGGFHNAGAVIFGPDGFLYVAFGDASDPANRQVLNRGFFCSVIRIDVDKLGGQWSQPIRRQPKIGMTQGYYIPKDNPFFGQDDVLEELYAFGFRNPFRMGFDKLTGLLWIGDNGGRSWEEINVVKPGSNCQHPYFEGNEPKLVPSKQLAGVEEQPFYSYAHTAYERSVIGGCVYRASKLKGLKDKYIYGDNFAGRLYALDTDGAPTSALDVATIPYKGQSGISSIFQTRQGEVLVTVLGSKKRPSGKVLQLVVKETGDRQPDLTVTGPDLTSRELFETQCALCHGLEGKGDGPRAKDLQKKPKDLTLDEWQDKVTDKHIYDVIAKGGAAVGLDNAMPGWHLYLPTEQIDDMVEFVRQLRVRERGTGDIHSNNRKSP